MSREQTKTVKKVELKLFHNDGMITEEIEKDAYLIIVHYDLVVTNNYSEYMRKSKQTGFFEVPKFGGAQTETILVPSHTIKKIEKSIDIRD